jgi:hypothetical protein
MDLKLLSAVETLEDFDKYAVDKNGNVYSFKHKNMKILKPGWKHKKRGYPFVRLCDKYGNKKNFYVNRLIALAYIPTDDITLEVRHKNDNCYDNRVENLVWGFSPKIKEQAIEGYWLDKNLFEKIQQVHSASIRKGLKVPNSYEFTNKMINDAMNQYINQYGLRKVM